MLAQSKAFSGMAVRDIDAAKRFYGAVFGWDAETNAYGETSYTEWKLGGRSIGGMIQMNEQWPEDVPPHWMVYFATDEVDAATRRVEELGGKVSVPPTDTPAGRFTVVNDPHGAVFSIIELATGDDGDGDGDGERAAGDRGAAERREGEGERAEG
jgi:uncharacterized protein